MDGERVYQVKKSTYYRITELQNYKNMCVDKMDGFVGCLFVRFHRCFGVKVRI